MKRLTKAISPLIATILLIVVAVALIAIVVAWGKSFTTGSLSEATGVVDTSCMGAAVQISGCTINDSNKMIFYVQNTGSIAFPAGDDFIINLTNVADGNATLNLLTSTTETTWAGIDSGETAMFVLDDANFPGAATGRYDVKIISSFCSSDAVAEIRNCSQ
jgi:flagellin-like protein